MTILLQSVQMVDFDTLERMLVSYIAELNPLAPTPLAGSYPYLKHYKTDSDRFAFFILHNNAKAGFALVRRLEEGVHELAEFSVRPAFRRAKLGHAAAVQLFEHFPGEWTFTVLRKNRAAQAFWTSVIEAVDPRYILTVPENPLESLRFRCSTRRLC